MQNPGINISGLSAYKSNEDALNAGLAINDLYIASVDHPIGHPALMLVSDPKPWLLKVLLDSDSWPKNSMPPLDLLRMIADFVYD